MASDEVIPLETHCVDEMKALQLTLTYSGGGFHEVDAAIRGVDGISRDQIMDIRKHSDGACVLLYHLSGDNIEGVDRILNNHPAIIRSVRLSETEEWFLFVYLDAGSPLTELLEIVERYALLLDKPIAVDNDRTTFIVGGSKQLLQRSLDDIPDGVTVSVDRIVDYTAGGHSVLSLLTERQREALETAIKMGYYDSPRRTTYKELGTELGCSSSTANSLLRDAERRVMTSLWKR